MTPPGTNTRAPAAELLVGHVEHARLHPVQHRFRNKVHYYAFDVDALEDLRIRGFAFNRFAPLSLRLRDYLTEDAQASFRDKLRPWWEQAGLSEPDSIRMLTSAKWWGFIFNPVSFYLLERQGKTEGMIAEVNNTFGDRHIYSVPLQAQAGPAPQCGEQPKQFHVSPFNNLEGRYRFSLRESAEELYIGVDLYRDGEKILETWIEGRRKELTTTSLWRENLLHPLRPWLTMPRIVWQAIFLRFKHKLMYHPRPEPASPDSIRAGGKAIAPR